MNHCRSFLDETAEIASLIKAGEVAHLVSQLVELRSRKGRLFVMGLGGSAANASHAVNDFRKLCGIEAYTPTDNVAEFTARANDEGWDTMFSAWMSFARAEDGLLILSVGGGTEEVSRPLVNAIKLGKLLGMKILGIVGRDGGFTKQNADCCIVIPTVTPERVTPHTEAFQSVILHCIVSHPDLQMRATKW